MKLKFIKCLISVLLCLTIFSSLFSVAAVQSVETEYPTLYLSGRSGCVYDADGKLIYPVDGGVAQSLTSDKEKLKQLVGYLLTDREKYCDLLYEMLLPCFEPIKLNNDGEIDNDTSTIYVGSPYFKTKDTKNLKGNVYTTYGKWYLWYMQYDWRISPLSVADEIDSVINDILAETGKTKVNLVSRCYSCNLVFAYISKYGTDKINFTSMTVPTVQGIGRFNAIFSGELCFEPDSVEQFVKRLLIDEESLDNDDLSQMLYSIVVLLNEVKSLGVTAKVLQLMIQSIVDDVMPRLLRDTIATLPSYWSMVSADYYEKARKYIFDGYEDEYKGLLEKTDAYYEYQKNCCEILNEAAKTVNSIVISKYGYQTTPICADSNEMSDGTISVRLTSFGATAANVKEKLTDEYIDGLGENAKYVSPDKKIDASTALFPDKTWFIRNIKHNVFPDCLNDLIVEAINNNITVWDNPQYTQYLDFHLIYSNDNDNANGYFTAITQETIAQEESEQQTTAFSRWLDRNIKNERLRDILNAAFNVAASTLNVIVKIVNAKITESEQTTQEIS